MNRLTTLLLISLCLTLSACIRPYQQEIVQGNRVTESALKQLQPGMSKDEVRVILGNPVLSDAFSSNRWEYYYTIGNVSGKVEDSKSMTLFFDENRLQKISGDTSFAEIDKLRQQPSTEPTGGTIVTKPTQKKKGIFSRN